MPTQDERFEEGSRGDPRISTAISLKKIAFEMKRQNDTIQQWNELKAEGSAPEGGQS